MDSMITFKQKKIYIIRFAILFIFHFSKPASIQVPSQTYTTWNWYLYTIFVTIDETRVQDFLRVRRLFWTVGLKVRCLF